MCEQIINEYYINLEYNRINKEETLTEISTLSKQVHVEKIDDASTRFLKAASIIEKNLSLFKSVCGHVDTVTTILQYLTNFGVKFRLANDTFEEEYRNNKEEIILSVMLTIFNVCREPQVHIFLETVIIKNSKLHKIQYDRLKNEFSNQNNEMVLLDDSDLYAVVSCLRIVGHSYINKIWVQVSIKQKFLSHIKRYFHLKDLITRICWVTAVKDVTSHTFHTCNINVISIWSENIARAKYLARLLKQDVVFINTHMDLYGGVMLLPWTKIFDNIYERYKFGFITLIQPSKNEVNLSNRPSDVESMSIYNLYYNGKWHKPAKGTYWKQNDVLLANATSEDLRMCFDSALKGLEIWKVYPLQNKLFLISKLIRSLQYSSKSLKEADKLVRYPHLDKMSLLYSQNDRFEVIQIRIPRGVIILKEKSEEMLFLRLAQILISGNSVIVLTDATSCKVAPYCDIFSFSQIPRGVINVLSNENTRDLELSLCTTAYANYEKRFFTSSWEETYINLTLPKQIVFPLLNANFINDIEHERLLANKDEDT